MSFRRHNSFLKVYIYNTDASDTRGENSQGNNNSQGNESGSGGGPSDAGFGRGGF